jgi:hypothetical protein
VGVFGSLILCINVRNTDVDDAVSPASPEASNQDVATVFRAIVLEEALDIGYPRSGPCSLEWGYGGPLVTLSGLLVVFYLNKNFK